MARGISQHLVEQVGELSDDSTVSVVYADQGAHGRDLRKVVLGAWGRGDIGDHLVYNLSYVTEGSTR